MINVNQINIERRILHILIGIILLLLIIFNLLSPLHLFFLLILSGTLSLISLKYKIPIVNFFLERFEGKEIDLPGKAFLLFMAGILLTLKLFPKNIALASIIILVFSDPISHIVGKTLGRTKYFLDKRKNIEGHIAGFIVGSLLAMFFVSPLLAIAGSLVAMLFESIIIEVQKIQLDDNLIIPLAAGTTMFLVFRFLM
ncbi:MAG: hypothetical protein AABX71_00580 [Nanoarchaeota archaeon]